MIVRDQPSAWGLLYTMQGSIVPRIRGRIFGIFALTVVVLLTDALLFDLPQISVPAMGVFGVALSLFLGFRNNAAYERWWEARTLWGTMIADARNLGREATLFVTDTLAHRRLLQYVVAFAHLHRGHLRGDEVSGQVEPWVGAAATEALTAHANPADAALREMAKDLKNLAQNGHVDGFGQMTLSRTLASLSLSQAGCERIANTPLPFVYSLLVRRTTYLYCILLPFALVDATSIFAPLLAAVVAYVFFGLQAVTHELEAPFRPVENGLPLDAMCRAIEISVAEALGDSPPPALLPQDSVLM